MIFELIIAILVIQILGFGFIVVYLFAQDASASADEKRSISQYQELLKHLWSIQDELRARRRSD
jgi:hypothetical protein